MRCAAAALAALFCASAMAQQPMYRSTMPDGKKVIADRPMPGAVKVEEMKLSPGNYAPGAPPPRPEVEPARKGVEADRRAAVKEELEKAQKAYDEALERQVKGKEEGPGDRIGIAKGGARISDAYYKRQEELAAQVEAARTRLEQAREAAKRVQ